jgi:O-antigen biosynthesis protein
VRRIGSGVPYADGAEDRLLDIMLSAQDRSSGSDELAAAIEDWATLYHLSHQRADLFRPLRVAPGTTVLDVGAGTGTAARALGERGARVLALEGTMARAQTAAARCEDLPEVEVVCGALDDLEGDERFDLVLLIGVLEYAGAAIGGGGGAPAMLERARQLLAPGGSVVVAIENQLGLKYLLGAAEDHHGRPWAGIDDYPGPPDVRTWTRVELAGMLHHAGFVHQRWMAPFPDYKLPSLVLDESLYTQDDAIELIDQLLLSPVKAEDHEPVRRADAAAAHRVMLRAGWGLDVASSFLVVASPERGDAERVVEPDTLAWLFGGRRRRPWRRRRRLTSDRQVLPLDPPAEVTEGWLTRAADAPRPFTAGRTLGQAVLDAVRSHDLDGLGTALDRWHAELESRAVPTTGAGAHPFLPSWSERSLPDGWLDVHPSNFVEVDGGLEMIDDEWRTPPGVDLDIARVRALWAVAQDIVTSGIEHPWGELATVRDVLGVLADLVGVELEARSLEAFAEAETELQVIVTGHRPEKIAGGWLDGSVRSIDVRADRRDATELAALREEVTALRNEAAALRAGLAQSRERIDELDADVRRLSTARGFAKERLASVPAARRVKAILRRDDG